MCCHSGQTTFLEQAYPKIRSPYQGPNSLPSGGQGRETWDASLFVGVQLWRGAELWFNPEVDQGFGLGPISKSSEQDNEAGELDESEEVLWMKLPTHKDAALPLDPCEEPLDEPTP